MPTTSSVNHLRPTPPVGIVVEPSPVRSLAADFPFTSRLGFNLARIYIFLFTFVAVTLMYISTLRCGIYSFRSFQHLDRFLFEHITVNVNSFKNSVVPAGHTLFCTQAFHIPYFLSDNVTELQTLK